VGLGAQAVDSSKTKTVVGLAGTLSLATWQNGYSRELEDQADRVGLRYAYEGGYDPNRGPALWKRFSDKYGSQNSVLNFFMGDHSTAEARIRNLQREIQLNYARPRGVS
jgi:predicted Zn-dependent protease